jgi:flavin-dependent dehydrogenase
MTAGSGCDVLLVEKSRFPRDKVCGEFVSAEGCQVLDRMDLIDRLDACGATTIDACRISDPSGRSVDAPLPELDPATRPAIGISRGTLDTILLDHARSRGVRILERHEAMAPILDDRRVCGAQVREVGRGRRSMTIRATVVVAADGRRSMLARSLHPQLCDPQRSHGRSWFGLKTHLAGDPARLNGRVELHLFDGGYVGLGAVEQERINVCLLTRVAALRACGGSPERLLRELVASNPAAGSIIRGLPTCAGWHSVGPLSWGVRRPTAAGALFVGDAAGTIDPFSGEGISNALRAAELAIETLLAAVEQGELSDDLARGYTRRWMQTFAPVTRRVRRFGRLFERPRLVAPAVRLLGGPGASWLPRLIAATRTGS